MERLENIVNNRDISGTEKMYRANFKALYSVPANDFEYDTRNLESSYYFKASDQKAAVRIAENLLERFNDNPYTWNFSEITVPSNTKELTLLELIEVASENLLKAPVSNTDIKIRQNKSVQKYLQDF